MFSTGACVWSKLSVCFHLCDTPLCMMSSTSFRCFLSPSQPPMPSTLWLMGRWNCKCFCMRCTRHEPWPMQAELQTEKWSPPKCVSLRSIVVFLSDMHLFISVLSRFHKPMYREVCAVLHFQCHCLRFILSIFSRNKKQTNKCFCGGFEWSGLHPGNDLGKGRLDDL